MLTMVLWTLLALATAILVLVVASAAGGDGEDRPTGVHAYLADVRAGVRTWRSERRGGTATSRPAAQPVETSIEDFFAASTERAPAYLGVDDLTDTLARARERATRGVSGLARR